MINLPKVVKFVNQPKSNLWLLKSQANALTTIPPGHTSGYYNDDCSWPQQFSLHTAHSSSLCREVIQSTQVSQAQLYDTCTISDGEWSNLSFMLSLLCWFGSTTAAVTNSLVSVGFSEFSNAVVDFVSTRLVALSSSMDFSAEFPCSCHAGITGVIVGNAGNCFLQSTNAEIFRWEICTSLQWMSATPVHNSTSKIMKTFSGNYQNSFKT